MQNNSPNQANSNLNANQNPSAAPVDQDQAQEPPIVLHQPRILPFVEGPPARLPVLQADTSQRRKVTVSNHLLPNTQDKQPVSPLITAPDPKANQNIIFETKQLKRLKSSQKLAQQPKDMLFMRCSTWLRDSHGLYDYESNSVDKVEFRSDMSGFLNRRTQDPSARQIEAGQQPETMPIRVKFEQNPDSAMCKIMRNTDNGEFTLQKAGNDESQLIWHVVPRPPQIGDYNYEYLVDQDLSYKIKIFDVIKLGRLKFIIKEFACENSGQTEEELRQQELKEALPVVCLKPTDAEQSQGAIPSEDWSEEAQKSDKNTDDQKKERYIERKNDSNENSCDEHKCRFCWGSESTYEDPCIVPCRCTGSIGLLHFKCLKNWLNQKVQLRDQGNVKTYVWRLFECEICKQAYPYTFKVGERIYRLVDVERPSSKKHLVMESLPLERNSSRTIHVLNFGENINQFKMGRGHDSEVRVNDISVSRTHAIIQLTPNGFRLQDNRSKFGTLVLCPESREIKLDASKTQQFQIGRTICSFTVQKSYARDAGVGRENQPTMEDEGALTSPEADRDFDADIPDVQMEAQDIVHQLTQNLIQNPLSGQRFALEQQVQPFQQAGDIELRGLERFFSQDQRPQQESAQNNNMGLRSQSAIVPQSVARRFAQNEQNSQQVFQSLRTLFNNPQNYQIDQPQVQQDNDAQQQIFNVPHQSPIEERALSPVVARLQNAEQEEERLQGDLDRIEQQQQSNQEDMRDQQQ